MENSNEVLNVVLTVLPTEDVANGMKFMSEKFTNKIVSQACVSAAISAMFLTITGTILTYHLIKKHKHKKQED